MKDWTFETKNIVLNFDSHVREQLPWYDLVTESVLYIARNYLPTRGTLLDIGCSTGNISKHFVSLCMERNAEIIAIDKSAEMTKAYIENLKSAPIKKTVLCKDITTMEFPSFDVGILFLTLMFLSPNEQFEAIEDLYNKCNEGGIIIIVDKVCENDKYFATVMKRLTMYWKLKNGAEPADIIDKELSLSGIQRPINFDAVFNDIPTKQFFQLGEFKGWVIEK